MQQKVLLLTLFLCYCSAVAKTPIPEDKEYFTVDYGRKKLVINVFLFAINTTDVIYEDAFVSDITDDTIDNVTISGLKNCTGKHVFFEDGWTDIHSSDMKLNFTLECPLVVVKYKCKNCSYDVDENGFGIGEFTYRNDITKIVADIRDYKDILDATHMTASDISLILEGDEQPTKDTLIGKRFKFPVLSAFIKKADLIAYLFNKPV